MTTNNETTTTGTLHEDDVRAALATLNGPVQDTRDDQGVLTRPYESGTVCQIDSHGGFTFARAADSTGSVKLVTFSPHETRALWAFWRVLGFMDFASIVEEAVKQKDQAKRDIEPALEASRPARRNVADILAAPNCQADILSHPPRVRRDAEGCQRIELKGNDGWLDEGAVEDVSRLARYGLVLVATDEAAYLMSAQDFDNPVE